MKGLPEINPDDLEPTIDIDLKTQKKILQLAAMLEKADHYTLLGVPFDADKKEIKAAYFAKMNEFHADKFFGKDIGSFGPRLQQIVQKLTKANDTLSRKKTRAEYDQYIASRQKTLGARTSVAPRARTSPPPEGDQAVRAARPAVAPIDVVPQIPKAPKAPKISDSSPTRPPSSNPAAAASTARPPRSARAREAARRVLARKMGKRSIPPPSRGHDSGPPVSADPNQVKKAVQDDLRKRYEARKNTGRPTVEKYTLLAEAAVEQGDWSQAVNHIKMAAQVAPEDSQVLQRAEEIQVQADRILAPRFLEQAKYEEKDGRFDRAARSYERAALGKNSAELFEKSAKCLLKVATPSEDDKRKLVEMARKSVTLDNRSAHYRLTLAKAYDVAGMRASAQGEVRRALELEPNNKYAKQLQKALK